MKKKIPETANIVPSDFVIVGGTGHLSVRKILPALFWRFLDKQRDFFLKNPRMRMLVNTYDKMEKNKKQQLSLAANTFLKSL